MGSERVEHHRCDAPVDRTAARTVVQRALEVGSADDALERDADRVATQVLASRASSLRSGAPPSGPTGRIQAKAVRAASSPAASRKGGSVDGDTASRIARAGGRGAPIDEAAREPLERGFGADFSQVRVHTGRPADELGRRLNARAFTTGSDIFFRRGEYEPSTSGGQQLLAHELAHVVQQDGGSDATVRRALGLEFETGWQVFHELPSKHPGQPPLEVPYKKEEPIYGDRQGNQGWSMETDGKDIEFVIEPPFDESPGGLLQLQQVMHTLLQFTTQLDALRNVARLTPATHAHLFQTIDADAVIRPNGDVLKAQPQATVGVRLDRIDDLFREMARQGNASDLSSSQGTDFFARRANAAAQASSNATPVNGQPASDELKGFLTLVTQYVKQGDAPGRRAYAKDIAYAMARTDFTTMFSQLPEAAYFRHNPHTFVTYVLTNAGFAGTGTDLLIKQRIADGQDTALMTPAELDALPRLPLTRGQWLSDISQGTDRLTQAATINTMAYTDVKGGNRVRAMGLLGNTTDDVGGNHLAGIILELRQMKRAIPATEWPRVAEGLMVYLIALNDHATNKAQAGQVQYARR